MSVDARSVTAASGVGSGCSGPRLAALVHGCDPGDPATARTIDPGRDGPGGRGSRHPRGASSPKALRLDEAATSALPDAIERATGRRTVLGGSGRQITRSSRRAMAPVGLSRSRGAPLVPPELDWGAARPVPTIILSPSAVRGDCGDRCSSSARRLLSAHTSVEALHLHGDVHVLRAAGRPVDRGESDPPPVS